MSLANWLLGTRRPEPAFAHAGEAPRDPDVPPRGPLAGDDCLGVWSQPSSWALPTMGLDAGAKLVSPPYLVTPAGCSSEPCCSLTPLSSSAQLGGPWEKLSHQRDHCSQVTS